MSDIRHYKEERPWGRFRTFAHNEQCTAKLLEVNAGAKLSLQSHKTREEAWYVISGTINVTIGDEVLEGNKGDEFVVPVGAKHRIEGVSDAIILEIAKGHFDEEDITRYDDIYGRTDA